MAKRTSNKQLRVYLQELKRQGLELEKIVYSGSGHAKLYISLPLGSRFTLVSLSPSDGGSGFENWKRDLKKVARNGGREL